MSDMADVIWSHLEHNGDEYDLAYSRSIRKLADDLQTLLSAAGFGLVANAKAEEWGVRWEAAGPFPEEVHAKPSKESAEKSIAGSAFPGVIVRRTVTEWEATL